MSMNILNDISAVYMKQVAESAVPGKPAEKLGAVTAIPKSEQEAARERLLAKAKAKREKMKTESLDPVGQEDADIDNDGDTDKSDKYLHKRRKTIGKAIAKKKGVKEGFSNWRQDLSEVMDDVEANKKIKEKKVDNKIKINPDMKEAVEELGGELVEMVELDEKALSKQQQKFMGMVYAVKKGEMKAPSPEVAKAASGMTKQQSKDFAKTKHKGLPKKVEESVDEMPMTPQELNLQKKKSAIDIMIAKRRQQEINKQK